MLRSYRMRYRILQYMPTGLSDLSRDLERLKERSRNGRTVIVGPIAQEVKCNLNYVS